jgi:hypothetical protein
MKKDFHNASTEIIDAIFSKLDNELAKESLGEVLKWFGSIVLTVVYMSSKKWNVKIENLSKEEIPQKLAKDFLDCLNDINELDFKDKIIDHPLINKFFNEK